VQLKFLVRFQYNCERNLRAKSEKFPLVAVSSSRGFEFYVARGLFVRSGPLNDSVLVIVFRRETFSGYFARHIIPLVPDLASACSFMDEVIIKELRHCALAFPSILREYE